MPPQNVADNILNLRTQKESVALENVTRGEKTKDYIRQQFQSQNKDAGIRTSLQKINTLHQNQSLSPASGKVSAQGVLGGTMNSASGKIISAINPELGAAMKLANIGSEIFKGIKASIEKVGYASFMLMGGTALLLDTLKLIIGFIPIAGEIIGPLIGFIAGLIFLLWFRIKGLKLTKWQMIVYSLGTIIDMTPVVDILLLVPCTATVILTVLVGGIQNTEAGGTISSLGAKVKMISALSR